MGFFDFVENFFFISLGIAFALVLLLVYHFKNRMSVAEKKSETMYGLLSSVVKEIKSLRSAFSGGKTGSVEPAAPVLKSEPEIVVNVSEDKEVIRVDLDDNRVHANTYSVEKIVVSDEDDSESDSEYGSDLDSDSDSMDDSEDEVSVENVDLNEIHADEEEVDATDSLLPENQPDQVSEESSPQKKISHTLDQLKKMNINQLKTIAIQSGLDQESAKLKKHELISLILTVE
jgi:hypothetical protein